MRSTTPLLLSLLALLPTTAAMATGLTGAIQTFERLSFQIDREREGFVRRARQQLTGGDALSTLSPSSYALKPGSAVCITGANDGIGRAAAVYLAKQGYATVLCARTQAKADEAVAYVQAAASGAQSAGAVIDLASFESVARGGDAIRAAAADLDAPLRGLLLNAGVWPTERRISADGLEEGIQVCHVSHFMLTQDLLPDLSEDGEEARVVTVSSSAHALAPGVDLSDQTWSKRTFDATTAYGESKLANLLFAEELASRAPSMADGGRITSLALHPGVVATSLFKEFTPQQSGTSLPTPPPQLETLLETIASSPPAKLAFKLPEDGCRTSCYALLAPGLPTGAYLSDCELTDVSPAAKDVKARRELWEWTEEWVAARRAELGEAAARRAELAMREAAAGE